MKDYNFIIGPGDDDYGRKIPFWKRKKKVEEEMKKVQHGEKIVTSPRPNVMPAPQSKVEMEVCVKCGELTNVPKDLHIDAREFYIEGAGQLCKKCGLKLNNG